MRWFAAFVGNAMVVLYSPHSQYLADFQKAQRGEEPWYQPLEQPGVKVARSNPDEDPGGYYALFVAQLAEKFSGQAGLKQQILGDDRNPAQLIGPASATSAPSSSPAISTPYSPTPASRPRPACPT